MGKGPAPIGLSGGTKSLARSFGFTGKVLHLWRSWMAVASGWNCCAASRLTL